MNPDIKYEIVMVIAMTACFVSGFLFVSWKNRSLILDLKLIMLALKILFIPESAEGVSDEAVQLKRVELDRNLMV